MMICEECDSDILGEFETYVQITGDADKPTLEITVATCVVCGHNGVVNTRVL